MYLKIILRSVFIIALVAVTMIGMVVPSVFADHAEVAIITVDESGFSQVCAEAQGGSGCYVPVTATVDVGGVVTMTNTDPTGVHTFTSGTVNGFTPSPSGVFDSSVLMSGDAFEWVPESAGEVPYYCMLHTWMIGTIIVQEAAAEEVEVIQLTINSFEIYEDGDYTRYHVIGDAPAATNLTFTMTKPDGSNGDYNGSAGTGQPSYNQDGLISPTSDLVYGTWNLEICAAEHNMCVQESFTINQPVILPDDGAFTLPCSMQENGDGVSSSSCHGFYQNGVARAEVGINYHSGILSIQNYQTVGFFIDENGNQGSNIIVNYNLINPGDSATLVFENNVSGFVSEFQMQMLGGEIVVEDTSAAEEAAAEAAAAEAAAAEAAAAEAAAEEAAAQAVGINAIVTVDESGFSQTCAEAQGGSGCYIPLTAVVNYGDTVTMTNTDPTGVHTFTSGTVNGFTPAPDGTFDTGVLMSGDAFEWVPESAGEHPYYCMLHTWMVGTIIVQGTAATETAAAELAAEEAAAAQAAAIEAAQEDAAEAAAAQAAAIEAAQAAAELAAIEAGAELAAAQAAAELAAIEAAAELAAAQAAAELAAAEAAAQVPEPQIPIILITSTGQTTYDIGDMVDVLVTATGFTGTQKVAIDVTDPRGNTVVSRSINLSSNITEDIEFRLSEDFKTGTYKVTTTTSDNGNTVLSTSHFKIKSQFNSFTISGLTVSDQQGNSSTLQAGEMGFIKVNLSSTKSIATLVTVNLFDSELTSIGIGSVQTTLASGESEIILSFMIPDDAATGPADIYVNAFSDWPSNGGTALTGELSSVEDIS
jgi:plastocyanin